MLIIGYDIYIFMSFQAPIHLYFNFFFLNIFTMNFTYNLVTTLYYKSILYALLIFSYYNTYNIYNISFFIFLNIWIN